MQCLSLLVDSWMSGVTRRNGVTQMGKMGCRSICATVKLLGDFSIIT